jgi:hypothetical protein
MLITMSGRVTLDEIPVPRIRAMLDSSLFFSSTESVFTYLKQRPQGELNRSFKITS